MMRMTRSKKKKETRVASNCEHRRIGWVGGDTQDAAGCLSTGEERCWFIGVWRLWRWILLRFVFEKTVNKQKPSRWRRCENDMEEEKNRCKHHPLWFIWPYLYRVFRKEKAEKNIIRYCKKTGCAIPCKSGTMLHQFNNVLAAWYWRCFLCVTLILLSTNVKGGGCDGIRCVILIFFLVFWFGIICIIELLMLLGWSKCCEEL